MVSKNMNVGSRVPPEGSAAAVRKAEDRIVEAYHQRNHLGWQLDRELDDLGVGLRRTSPGSPENDRVPGWSTVPTV